MARDEQLEWEARAAKPAAAGAFGSVVLLIAGFLVQVPALRDAPSRNAGNRYKQSLLSFHEHAGGLLVSSILSALATVLVAGALFYLYRAARHRRRQVPAFIVGLLVLAPVLALAAALIGHFSLRHTADQFLSSGAQSNSRAKHLIDNQSAGKVVAGVGQGAGLALAIGFVMVSLNAMRVGLLTRFMGFLGIIAGVLLVIPLFPVPVVEIFWLGALGFVFLGYYRGGRGPAWEVGEAVPWPTAAERAQAGGGGSGRGRSGGGLPEPPPPEPETAEPSEGPRPASRKRKRRKRR